MEKIGGWYVSPEARDVEFAGLVADIVEEKLSGIYKDLVPEVIGGWAVSQDDQDVVKAQLIADVIVDRIGVKA